MHASPLRSWTFAVAATLSSSLFAQQNTPPSPALETSQPAPLAADERQHPMDHHLVLDVVVTDRKGKPVSGLQQGDFVALDNQKPARVTSFRAVNGPAASADPLKILILVDEVNTNFSNVAFERDSIKSFLKQDGGRLAHPVSLIFFSDTGTEMLKSYSQDGNALAAELDAHDTKLRTIRRSTGFYGAVDRLQLSIRNLQTLSAREETQPGRKLLIWVSPGWPYLSGPRTDLSNREADGIFHSVVALSASLRRARMTLYSVDPLGTEDSVGLRTNYWREFDKGIKSPRDAEAADLSLQVLAYQSGGEVLNSNNDVASLINHAAAEADSYYEVTIEAPPAEHPDEYHALQIKLEQSGFTPHTRTGYYDQP